MLFDPEYFYIVIKNQLNNILYELDQLNSNFQLQWWNLEKVLMALGGDPLQRGFNSQNMTKTQLALMPSPCLLRLNSEEREDIAQKQS